MEPEQTGNSIYYEQKYQDYITLLQSRLSEKRFRHSLAVADEALRLAKKYSCDPEKAFEAGLLHDICKDTDPNEQLKLMEQFGIMLDNVEKGEPKLWHAMAGAAYIQHVLKLEDPEIISAVRYHTTARAGMSLLEKIIFLADFTSSDRDYDGVAQLRQAVDCGLDTAMYEALCFSVEDLKQRGRQVHHDTLEAFLEAGETFKRRISDEQRRQSRFV